MGGTISCPNLVDHASAVALCTTLGRNSSCLELEFTHRKVCGSNLTSASRFPLSRLGQPGSIPALVLPSGGMAARYRKGTTAERLKETAHKVIENSSTAHDRFHPTWGSSVMDSP
ncbi:hypothetical protein T265_10415 [Opisthorchis viverrini]|uniref:Uncharacterized protein n=1 Tax=Opisthorchis viverrini TaxID=6198 RepID=A0A074ZDD3_OPIVI|nr:hypothetical protein T265_10415 [Opisthorchis viverrini]KER21205.1 hypothetical protein T265_10415 [Opisthorchis viverrini]